MVDLNPQKLAIFYGWPSTINGSTTVAEAVSHYQAYNVIVFPQGVEDPAHGDHVKTNDIINDAGMASTSIYGYVDATIATSDIYLAVDRWFAMNVAGIFFDRFGYDFNLTRDKQNALVDYAHYKNLNAFVNAWNPDDVFSAAVGTNNPNGSAARVGANDYYLAESYQIINGAYQSAIDWRTKSDKMTAYKASHSTKMAAVTTNDASAFDQAKADYSYYSAVMDELDAWGWGELYFSASTSQMPYRARKEVYGTMFDGPIVENAGVYERGTNVGIHVDSGANTVDYLLD